MSLMTPRCSEGALDWPGVRGGFLELLTKICVGLLEAVPMTAGVAADLAGDEAEGRRSTSISA